MTEKPNIVTAYAPKRTRRRRRLRPAAMPKVPAIVEARDPRRIKRNPGLARRVVENGAPDLPDELERRGDAVDRLFAEIKRAVAEQHSR